MQLAWTAIVFINFSARIKLIVIPQLRKQQRISVNFVTHAVLFSDAPRPNA